MFAPARAPLSQPVINIANDVRWGRVEETYGEDPLLSSIMGRAFIEPIEQAGIVTTPKHFVANVGEGGRDSYPIDVSRRQLEEYFFPPFKSAVRQAHARSAVVRREVGLFDLCRFSREVLILDDLAKPP